MYPSKPPDLLIFQENRRIVSKWRSVPPSPPCWPKRSYFSVLPEPAGLMAHITAHTSDLRPLKCAYYGGGQSPDSGISGHLREIALAAPVFWRRRGRSDALSGTEAIGDVGSDFADKVIDVGGRTWIIA